MSEERERKSEGCCHLVFSLTPALSRGEGGVAIWFDLVLSKGEGGVTIL